MATPDDEAFRRKYGSYKPAEVNLPVTTIRPIIGGETPEAAAARRADEERKQSGEQRDVTAARLAQEAADRAARGETSALEDKAFARIGSLRTEFLGVKEVKDFRDVQNATRQIIDLTSKGTPIGNIGSVFSLMKILDPGSTVREGEAASVQNAAGVPDRFRNAYNQLLSGEGLSQSQRNDMADVARSIYNQRLTGYNSLAETYRGLMTEQGADPDKQGITLATPYEIKAATGGAGTEGPAVTVSPEDSIATFGQLTYDKDRNLVGRAYQASGGALFDAQGNALGITGVVSDESLQAPAPSFYEGVLNSITGSDQSTATTESLPDWVDMPGMNNLLSSAAWKAGFGTAFGGSPQEIAQIVQSNFPGTQVFQDEKGNYILRSATDGKDYAIKPGFQLSDVPRAANIIGAGLLTGGRSAMGVAGREALMQTGIEATQTATGGTFNPADIAAAAVLGGGIQKGFEVLPGAAGRVVGRIMGNTPPGGGGGGGGAIPDIPGGIPLPGGGVSPAPSGSMAPGVPMPSVGAAPSAAIPQTPTGMGGLSSAPTTGSNPLIFSVAPTEILERSGTRAKPGPGVLDDANIQDRDVVLDALGLPRENRRLGAQTGNKSQIEDEVMISKLGEGSERMQDQFDRESQHLGEYALDLIDRTGGTLNLNTTARGAAIVKPLESYQAWYRDQIKMLYTQADAAAAASGVPITLQGLNDALRVDSTFASKGSLITLRNGVRKYLKEINAVDKAGNPLPLETQMAENVRKYLNDNWTPENSAVIGRLKSTIDNDVLSALPVDVYANARQMRANYGDIFEKPEGLAKILEIDGPEGINRTIPLDVIGDRFTNWAQKNSAQFNNIIKTLENMPTPVLQQEGKQAVGEIRANLLESILKKNVDFEDISQGGDAMWAGSDKSLGSNMMPYKGKMVDLFGTDIANRLETLRVGARILRPVDPNPSGTATASQRLVSKTRERLIRGTGVTAGGSIGGTLGSILGPYGTTIGATIGGATGERIGVKMVQSAEVAARKRAIEASLDPAAKARQLTKMRARKGGQ